MALTTPDRVRRRLGYSDPTLTEQALIEYIEDAESYIQRVTRTLWEPGMDGYTLAVSICTDLAAVYAVIRPAGGLAEGLDYTIDEFTVKKSKQLESRMRTAAQFRQNAKEGLDALAQEDTSVPVSNTGYYG